MAPAAIQDIENRFAQLPRATQWSVIERLVHHLRSGEEPPSRATWEAGLAAMAADPEVQHELAHLAQEFSATEADGLGRA